MWNRYSITLAAAALSVASPAIAIDATHREHGSRRRGAGEPLVRSPHPATLTKPKSASLARMLGRAR